jgi:hypothetical protein
MLIAKGVKGRRLDCVRLKVEVRSPRGSIICARVLAIVSTESPAETEPLCICTPLYKANTSSLAPLDEIQSLVVEYFPLVREDHSRLFVLKVADIECHEQIQFISGIATQHKHGLVNIFCQSKIAQSDALKTPIQIDSDTVGDEGEDV